MMGQFTETLHGSQGSARCLGVVSGFTLKMIRESIGLTQVELARDHEVDVATIQGWESGRRPLTALRVRDLARLRARLFRLSASPGAIRVLDDAIDADLIVSDAVGAGDSLVPENEHLLGTSAHQRTLTTLITWPFTGTMPNQLVEIGSNSGQRRRRGPVATGPTLAMTDRDRFFDHLLMTADAHRNASLLRRQAIYLLGFDRRIDTVSWLRNEQMRAVRSAVRHNDVPSSVGVRSSAIALAETGDPEPLTRFVRTTLADDHHARANLNYWAYWVGEIDTVHVDDSFMVEATPGDWSGARLMAHLADRLDPNKPLLEMYVNTLWSLLMMHPNLLQAQSKLRLRIMELAALLHDTASLSGEIRRELSDITYAARSAQR